jgi:hypothetical protein
VFNDTQIATFGARFSGEHSLTTWANIATLTLIRFRERGFDSAFTDSRLFGHVYLIIMIEIAKLTEPSAAISMMAVSRLNTATVTL